MKPRLLFLLLLAAVVVSAPAQLLWKISGNGLIKPSYVVGTYHLAPASFADSIPGLNDALAASEQVFGELDMRNLESTDVVAKMTQAMTLPKGMTIDSLLTAEQMDRLNAFMRPLMGVDMTHPMVAEQMKRFTPSALTTEFTVLMAMKRNPGLDIQNLLDAVFQKKAADLNKPIGGLESIDLQIKVLYGSKTLERQVEELMCLVDHAEFYTQVTELLADAFYSQNLKAIQEAADQKLHSSCDARPEEEEALIYGRNADWVKKMPAIMQQNATFFAVGAAHLPGEKGMIQLLQKAGYTVEAVQ